MTAKTRRIKGARITLDAAMYLLFLLLMERHLLSAALHEWFGISLFVLFIAHTVLNYKWYAALFKGEYTGLRIRRTACDFLLLIAMLLCMVSSLFISGVIWKGLNLSGARVGREVHLAATAWAFVLMSIHLGLHWSSFVAMGARVKMPERVKRILVWCLRIAALSLAVFGAYVFFARRFYEEMFLLTAYKFFDFGKNPIGYFFETFSLSALFTTIAYYAEKCYTVKRIKDSKKGATDEKG